MAAGVAAVVVLLIVNAVLALVGAGLAAMAARRPSSMSYSPEPSPGERFYARMYAVRGIPLGLLAAVVPLLFAGPAAALTLVAAAAAQVGDALIGAARRETRMIAGGGIAAAVHVAAAVVIW
jgi:hypothetical protein